MSIQNDETCPKCGKSDGYLETIYIESCDNCGYYQVYHKKTPS